jgi:hypothetical protein
LPSSRASRACTTVVLVPGGSAATVAIIGVAWICVLAIVSRREGWTGARIAVVPVHTNAVVVARVACAVVHAVRARGALPTVLARARASIDQVAAEDALAVAIIAVARLLVVTRRAFVVPRAIRACAPVDLIATDGAAVVAVVVGTLLDFAASGMVRRTIVAACRSSTVGTSRRGYPHIVG